MPTMTRATRMTNDHVVVLFVAFLNFNVISQFETYWFNKGFTRLDFPFMEKMNIYDPSWNEVHLAEHRFDDPRPRTFAAS